MIDLYKEFTNWLEYNFPAVVLMPFQQDTLKAILAEGIPSSSKELAEKLKDLLPKAKKEIPHKK